ncbi:MAG: putative Multidrug efflux transporter [Nitrospira sp.]|nr:putative Multidrug efflux transporter [Nitrospira sp.]
MRLSELSIRRPVLATVMTLLLMLFGLLSYSRLSVREYPDITFPVVSVLTVCAQRNRRAPHTTVQQPRRPVDHRR